MMSERLRKREVYSDRPLRDSRIIIDGLTKRLVMCIESMTRDGICTQKEAEEMVLTSMEKVERKLHRLSDDEFESFLNVEIAKVDLANALMKEGALK